MTNRFRMAGRRFGCIEVCSSRNYSSKYISSITFFIFLRFRGLRRRCYRSIQFRGFLSNNSFGSVVFGRLCTSRERCAMKTFAYYLPILSVFIAFLSRSDVIESYKLARWLARICWLLIGSFRSKFDAVSDGISQANIFAISGPILTRLSVKFAEQFELSSELLVIRLLKLTKEKSTLHYHQFCSLLPYCHTTEFLTEITNTSYLYR